MTLWGGRQLRTYGMYMCMCESTYAHVCAHTCIHEYDEITSVQVHSVCTCIRKYMHTYTHVHREYHSSRKKSLYSSCLRTYIHTHTHVHRENLGEKIALFFMFTQIHAYIHAYIHTHTYSIHTYTHVHRNTSVKRSHYSSCSRTYIHTCIHTRRQGILRRRDCTILHVHRIPR